MSKLSKLSDENIQDLFETAFEEQIASNNEITEFECKCIRSSAHGDKVSVEVTVSGMAGSPTFDDFIQGNVNRSGVVNLSYGDDKFKFKLEQDQSISLNANDYMVTYSFNG
jgi:hypothetical protein